MRLWLLLYGVALAATTPSYPKIAGLPLLPSGTISPLPAYMVDNQRISHRAAPDKGAMHSAIITNGQRQKVLHEESYTTPSNVSESLHQQASTYWYPGTDHGVSPLAPSGYKVYRNVMDYGAKGDGATDDTDAINRAITDGNRCGSTCGSTSVLYAVVYFPAGTYMISAPIVQYYFTQFIGDPTNRPTIKGMANFQGIALIDNDVYIPGGNGDEWYINQNQFYRTIKNFVIDLTLVPNSNGQPGQNFVPTGIHWQVAQATSLQNIYFSMPVGGPTQAVGIFMENGSGGFVSDLTFYGGHTGFVAGSQQFTARNLSFNSNLIAVSMLWDWGFTWQQISVTNTYIAFNVTAFGGASGQGTGSISVIDSTFNHVPYAIPYVTSFVPNMVLDNLKLYQVPQVVFVNGQSGCDLCGPSIGSTTTQTVQSWGMGRRYAAGSGSGGAAIGNISPVPSKPASMLDANGNWFTQSKPTYAGNPPTVVATNEGIMNDGTGDQSAAINAMLSQYQGEVIFFPAGIYNVQNTVFVPSGTIMLGEAWSQIRGTGAMFQDSANPIPVVRVGQPEDIGSVQISDFLFTVSGPTSGAILVEWNIQASFQGATAMWDCHFRVGGAAGSNLQLSQCPKGKFNSQCEAASLLLHVTSSGNGYFENVWAWVADHDLDASSGSASNTSATQISIYSARGVLIESPGPTWFYGTASEHNSLYQYNIFEASNIYLGHMQTETPYYQPNPIARQPFTIGQFNGDPTFADCTTNPCEESWALRLIYSTNVFVYSAGLYSFFSNYNQTCVKSENCQLRILETQFTEGFWLYNLFTKGVVQPISAYGLPTTAQSASQHGFTTEISAYLGLSISNGNLGNSSTWSNSPYTTCRPRLGSSSGLKSEL